MEATEARLTLQQFITSSAITMTAEWADSNPHMDDMPRGSSHWKCILKCGRRQMTVPFSQGPAVAQEPTIEDVLSCLALDAAGYEIAQSFEDWCAANTVMMTVMMPIRARQNGSTRLLSHRAVSWNDCSMTVRLTKRYCSIPRVCNFGAICQECICERDIDETQAKMSSMRADGALPTCKDCVTAELTARLEQ